MLRHPYTKYPVIPLASASSNTLYLLDGSGFIFRAFYALPPLTTSEGTPIGAVVGFCTMILKLLDQFKPTHWAVALDTKAPTFRHEMCPDYKSHRQAPPPELIPQFASVKEACLAFHIPILEKSGVEADDLMASYAEKATAQGWEVILISSDKDLMQLVTPKVTMYDPMKDVFFDEAAVQEKWGVPPEKIPDMQALMGDASDNIKGIPGVGPKTALRWIQHFESLNGVLHGGIENVPSNPIPSSKRGVLIEYGEQARKGYRLAYLKRDVSLPISLEDLHYKAPEPDKLSAFLETYQLKQLQARLLNRNWGFTPSVPIYPSPTLLTEHRLEEYTQKILEAGSVGLFPVSDKEENLENHPWAALGLCLPGERGVGLSLSEPGALSFLYSVLSDTRVIKVVCDAKQWIHTLSSMGHCFTPPFEDVLIASYLMEGGVATKTLEDVLRRTGQADWMNLEAGTPPEKAAFQAEALLRGYELLKKQIRERRCVTVYETLEKPLVPILAAMERLGICVDVPYLEHLSQDFSKQLHQLEHTIYAMTGRTFNVASPKQLGEVLFQHLGWKSKKGKGDTYSTASTVLQTFADQGEELASVLLQWRQLAKLNGTYTQALSTRVDPKTHRLSTQYSMVTTSTGRLSSLHPNLQNIPIRTEEGRKIRHAFMAAAGYTLLRLDYSQIELRIVAHLGQVDALQKAFRAHEDVHAETACHLFQCTPNTLTAERRRVAKIINFGIMYGMSSFGLSQQLKIPPPVAQEYINAYFQRYPELLKLAEKHKEQARSLGYVTTLWGRRCTIPMINSPKPSLRQAAERQAINAPIQGSCADILKRAMIHVAAAIPPEIRLLLQVHDELILEVPEDQVDSVTPMLCALLEEAAHLSVPLVVNSTYSSHWS